MNRPGVRGYTTYEDVRLHDFIIQREVHSLLDRRFDLPGYLRMRRNEGCPRGRAGFKHSPLCWLGHDPATLPLEVLRVDRPLEASIASDTAKADAIDPGRSYAQRIQRVAEVAAAWQAARDLQPKCWHIAYDQLIDEPEQSVLWIASWLRLTPTPDQIQTAVDFIDPELRHF